METILVQINSDKAYRLMQDLEDLQILKVLKRSVHSQQRLSEKYSGILPADVADQLQEYITKSRNDWNNSSN